MSSPLLRLALAASWSGRGMDRRRAAMMALAAAVVTIVASGCVSTWLLSTRINDRAAARDFAAPSRAAPPAFEVSGMSDQTLDGEQFSVLWWRVLDPTARIPGIEADPPPGSWFVSPALAERMAEEPGLAQRYADARRIGAEGVAQRGELLAYRFVGPDVALDELLSKQPEEGSGDPQALELFPVSVVALGLVGIPGLGLLLAAMAPFAVQVEHRLSLLGALGASPRAQRNLVVAHTALCAGPGALAGAAGWFLVSPHLVSVPFVGRGVFVSDLGLPLVASGAIAVAVTALTVIVAAVRPRMAPANRPVGGVPDPPGPTRLLPLVTGVAAMLAGTILDGPTGARIFLTGVIAATVGTVIALPMLINRAGAKLARRPETVWLLVGRRLRWNAVPSSRSLLGVGALATLLPLASAWFSTAEPGSRSDSTSYAVELRGSLSGPERQQLAERADAMTIDITHTRQNLVTDTSGQGPRPRMIGEPTTQLVGDCASLAAFLRFARCGPDGFELAADSGMDLGRYATAAGIATRPPGAGLSTTTLFLSGNSAATESILRSFVVNASHGGMQVSVPARSGFRESPLVAWILGAASLAGLVGAAALVLHLVGQAARLARSRIQLLAFGADAAVVRRLAGYEAAVAVAIVGIGCTAVGYISSWMFVQIDPRAAVPYVVLVLILVGTLFTAGLAGLAAAAAIPSEARTPGHLSR